MNQLVRDVRTGISVESMFLHFCVVLPVTLRHFGVCSRWRGVRHARRRHETSREKEDVRIVHPTVTLYLYHIC